MMPSMSLTLRPASAMALRIASTSRSRLDTPGTWPSRLWPAPTTAQTSRSSRDGSIMGGPRRCSGSFRELADAGLHLRRRGVNAVEQSIDLLPAAGIDLGMLAPGGVEENRVFHGGIEGRIAECDRPEPPAAARTAAPSPAPR